MKSIPFVDIRRMYDPLRQELHRAALEVIDSGRYIGGEQVKAFEREMAAWMGVPEVCGVSCATLGAFSLLKCFGIGPGDEVITTVHTAIATGESISHTGARVVFCDIKPGYFFLDPAEVMASGDFSEEVSTVYGHGHLPYIAHVIDAILNDKPGLVEGEEGRKNIEILTALYESAACGGATVVPGQASRHSRFGQRE